MITNPSGNELTMSGQDEIGSHTVHILESTGPGQSLRSHFATLGAQPGLLISSGPASVSSSVNGDNNPYLPGLLLEVCEIMMETQSVCTLSFCPHGG